jgi:hypothetical protein
MEGDQVDAAAFKALIREAVALNSAGNAARARPAKPSSPRKKAAPATKAKAAKKARAK